MWGAVWRMVFIPYVLNKVTSAGDVQALFSIEAKELLTFPEVLSLVKA